MFALTVPLLSVFCITFNCALGVGVLCLLKCALAVVIGFASTVLLLSVFCVCFNYALAIGFLCLL